MKLKSKILLDKTDTFSDYPKCDMEGCNKIGLFKAPKNRGLKEYFNFCEEHVSKYNKNWNFYDGMTTEEIEHEHTNDIYKRNPTWNFGLLYFNKNFKNNGFNDLNGFFDKIFINHTNKICDKLIKDSLKVMNLSYPFTLSELKSQYKILVKKYHPDLSKDEKDKKIKEEKFKQVIDAYQKLDNFLKNNK